MRKGAVKRRGCGGEVLWRGVWKESGVRRGCGEEGCGRKVVLGEGLWRGGVWKGSGVKRGCGEEGCGEGKWC